MVTIKINDKEDDNKQRLFTPFFAQLRERVRFHYSCKSYLNLIFALTCIYFKQFHWARFN